MEKMINILRKKEGYVSIETIIVAGLVIGLGAISLGSFRTTTSGVMSDAVDTVNTVGGRYTDINNVGDHPDF